MEKHVVNLSGVQIYKIIREMMNRQDRHSRMISEMATCGHFRMVTEFVREYVQAGQIIKLMKDALRD